MAILAIVALYFLLIPLFSDSRRRLPYSSPSPIVVIETTPYDVPVEPFEPVVEAVDTDCADTSWFAGTDETSDYDDACDSSDD